MQAHIRPVFCFAKHGMFTSLLCLQVSCVTHLSDTSEQAGVQVLCASNDAHDQVEPIAPPQDVPVGEKITFEG